jgi:hypothetical protein
MINIVAVSGAVGVIVWVLGILTETVHAVAFEIKYVNLTEHKCSATIGVSGVESCLAAHLKFVDKHDEEPFLVALQTFDDNSLVQRIYIDAMALPIHGNVSVIGHALDLFLTPRPWWTVISEKYKIHHEHADRQTTHAFLMRFNPAHEQYLRFVAAIQYPPTATNVCSMSMLLLGHMLDKGWGSQLTLWEVMYRPFAVFNVWDSVGNEKSETVKYASALQCPDLVNKRECAFLPLTNCSMPACFSTARGQQLAEQCWDHSDYVAYSNASANAKIMSHQQLDLVAVNSNNEYQHSLVQQYNYRALRRTPFPPALFIDAQGKKLAKAFSESIIAPYAFLLRPNAEYRDLIMDDVHAFQHANSFPLGLPCVTFQIRRGDRVDNVKNITEYCNEFQAYSNGTCTRNGKIDDNCANADDYGCFTHNPFGALTLTHYLEQAVKITEATTAFIFTDDDGVWLDEQIKGLEDPWTHWNFNVFTAKYDHHSPRKTQDAEKTLLNAPNRQTLSGVEFLTGLALARQCQAFIGHFSSGFVVALYRLMCLQHGHSTGQCPNASDIGNIYDDFGSTIFARTIKVP